MDKLDNPVWSALTTEHAGLAVGDEKARRYPATFTSLAGICADSADAYLSLFNLLDGQSSAGLCSLASLVLPDALRCSTAFPVLQMVCERLVECKQYQFEKLSALDVPRMKELAALTKPGPFSDRTIEFGTFIGIKVENDLIAMAGERMKLVDYNEVSAVCTHPQFQGRGYARALVSSMAQLIFARGKTPFLHVRADNLAAIRSYEAIGFKARCELQFSIVRRNQDLATGSAESRAVSERGI